MVMDKEKEEDYFWINWWSNFIYLWYSSTLQPSNFGRVYAAYSGIFVVASIIWGLWIDKKKPDRYEVIGSFIVLSGAVVIFYSPR